MGSFYNHILHIFRQLRKWVTFGEARIGVRDPLEYGWEEDNVDYILAANVIAFAPAHSFEFCQNEDPLLPRTVLEEGLQLQDEGC